MTQSFHFGTPPIEVQLRRSARAKRYSLRISNIDGKVSLTLPKRASRRAALEFARQHEGWLRAAFAKRPQMLVPVFGQEIPFRGQAHVLTRASGRRVLCAGDCLHVPGPDENLPARLRGFLRVEARDHLSLAAQKYATRLGRKVLRITLRDTRTRWGSCSAAGNLMFSWRLIMAPPAVLDYVAAHEVAHLAEMNHSAAFWQVVADLMPDYETHRRWLKQNGAGLHRYLF